MAITSQSTFSEHVASGETTEFPFNFYVIDRDVLRVSADGVAVPRSQWSASGFGNSAGGVVTFAVAPVSGTRLRIWRQTPAVQAKDFEYNSHMPSEVIGQALDRSICIVQELMAAMASVRDMADVFRNNGVVSCVGTGALAAMDTAGLPVGKVAMVYAADMFTARAWVLLAGTDANNPAGGVVRPHDYLSGAVRRCWYMS